MDEVTGEWRKLNNEEHHDLYLLAVLITQKGAVLVCFVADA
jgi:hypothetical protein